MSKLQNAYNSLWDAIDNWPYFDGVFKRTYRFNDDDSPEINPKIVQLPALAIFPDPAASKMVLNKSYEHGFKLVLMYFTPTWNLQNPLTYWEELHKAAWQSDGGGGTPYVKNVTGYYPENETQFDLDRIMLDGGKAILSALRMTLRVRFNPQGS